MYRNQYSWHLIPLDGVTVVNYASIYLKHGQMQNRDDSKEVVAIFYPIQINFKSILSFQVHFVFHNLIPHFSKKNKKKTNKVLRILYQ